MIKVTKDTTPISSRIEVTLTKDRFRYHDAMMLQHVVLQTYSTLISFVKVGEQKTI